MTDDPERRDRTVRQLADFAWFVSEICAKYGDDVPLTRLRHKLNARERERWDATLALFSADRPPH